MTTHLQMDNACQSQLLSLPAELRATVLEYVFPDNTGYTGIIEAYGAPRTMFLDDTYTASDRLKPLLVCRQFYHDSALLGFSSTTFLITSLFGNIPERLSKLQPNQITAIRNISFVADARHFRALIDWKDSPFGMPNLKLDTLTIILHRSSFWHYLFDYTSDITRLLRKLSNVKKFIIVRNGARVKGSFKTWYNRLIGYIMKHDHQKRYDHVPPRPEQVWWSWSFDDEAQTICFEARPPKPLMEEQEYMESILPLMEDLRVSVESEEWNPDPRSRYMYY